MTEDYDTLVKQLMAEKQQAFALLPPENDYAARAERMKVLGKTRKQEEPLPPVQLPFWEDPERVSPNSVLRSALFSCARLRRFVKGELVASWSDTEIRFSGETLNQFDESVWMQLVHMFRQQGEPADFKVRFNAKPFLRTLGKAAKGGASVGVLRSAMIRLRGGTLVLTHLGMEYGGGLLQDYTLDEDRGYFVATLNPKYLQLLDAGYTRLDWETRKALPTGLSTWMHRYILSHKATKRAPHRIGLEQLRELSGMTSAPKEFKRTLSQAMKKIKQHSLVSHWRITPQGSLEFIRPAGRRRRPGPAD